MTEDRAANLPQVVVMMNASGYGTCRRGSKLQSWKATQVVSAPLHSHQMAEQLQAQVMMALFDCGIYQHDDRCTCSKDTQKYFRLRSQAMVKELPVEAVINA